jgi:hypothetical protein
MIKIYTYLKVFPFGVWGNAFLPLEVSYSNNFLPLLPVSFFGIGFSRKCDIEFFIVYRLIFLVSLFYYTEVRSEDTENCSNPHPYGWGCFR